MKILEYQVLKLLLPLLFVFLVSPSNTVSRNEKQMVPMLMMVCLYMDMGWGWGISFEETQLGDKAILSKQLNTMLSLPVCPALLPLYVGIGSAAC